MNQVGALDPKANAELAASGINSLASGSFGADFALLLGQISQNGSQGLGGAVSSQQLNAGRTGYAASAAQSQQAQRKKTLNSDADPSGAIARSDSGDSGRTGRAEGGRRIRSSHEDGGRAQDPGQRNDAKAAQEMNEGRGTAEALHDAGDQAPEAMAQDAPAGNAQAQDDAGGAVQDSSGAAAFATLSNGAAAAGLEDPALDLADDAVQGGAPDGSALPDALENAGKKGAQGARLQGEALLQEPSQGSGAEEASGGIGGSGMDDAIKQDPVQARQVSDRSAALGELFADAGVTRVTVTQTADGQASQDMQEADDALSSIADSVQAAAELFPEQDAGEGGSADARGSGDEGSLDGALAVLRNGSAAASGEEGGDAQDQAEGEGLGGQPGNAQILFGKAAQGAAAQENGAMAAAQSDAGAGASGIGSAMAAPSSASGTPELSQARVQSRQAMGEQSLRDAMLTLSSDARENAERIAKAVMAMSARNLKSFSFDLNPEGLGKMSIQIDEGSDGDAVRIGISANSPQTRAILADGMDALRQGLVRNGIFAQADLEGGFDGSMGQGAQDGGAWQGQGGRQEQGRGEGRAIFAQGPEAKPQVQPGAQEADEAGASLAQDALSLFA
ncbi:MAG: flagellar hook-length control protein FliK [Succinivibrio sp.]